MEMAAAMYLKNVQDKQILDFYKENSSTGTLPIWSTRR